MNVLDYECSDCTSLYFVEPSVKPILINASWSLNDYLGALRVRTSLNRNNYTVEPGLYAIGHPGVNSEVLVTSNYKLTLDVLRRDVKGLDLWLLVLDTKGVNVWCAAGKGTFGTKELIHQIESTGIKNRIEHKRIIVPQLGAPGIAAHEVKGATGLNVKYGPVRSKDIKHYLAHNRTADAEMRRVNFTFTDRLKLTPVEVVYSSKYLFMALAFVLLIAGFNGIYFSKAQFLSYALPYAISIIAAFFSGTVIGPLLLPVLPFRNFALKGVFSGLLVWLLIFLGVYRAEFSFVQIGFLFASLTAGSFFTMNFTGASTYTSLSGVLKEMKYAVPAQIATGAAGIIALVISIFI